MSHKRERARRLAVQALYQWSFTGQTVEEIEAQFVEREAPKRAELDYFRHLLQGTVREHATLDALYDPLLDRPASQLDPVERAILRLAAFELRDCIETPYRVVIDQAVEMAHQFGAEQSHRFINGVVDRLAGSLRQAEVAAARR